MSSIVVFLYFDPALATSFCELISYCEKFFVGNGKMVVTLDKAVYGCIESAKLWHQHFKATLEELGLVPNPEEECCFNLEVEEMKCTVMVYVDDH